MSELARATADALPPDYFLFTVAKTADGVQLNGMNGIEWKKLEIQRNPQLTYSFNHNGPVY